MSEKNKQVVAEADKFSGKANGIFISTASAFEKIKNLSGTTLLNLRRNPEATRFS